MIHAYKSRLNKIRQVIIQGPLGDVMSSDPLFHDISRILTLCYSVTENESHQNTRNDSRGPLRAGA